MESAESVPVRLKATTEILDRAGIRGGQDISVDVEVNDSRPAAQVVAERLARLAEGAQAVAARVRALEVETDKSDGEIVDAEVVAEIVEEQEEPLVSEVVAKLNTEVAIETQPDLETELDDDLETEARE
jgi:antitoxin component of MazEF toxin-antitoxin module